MKMITAIQCTQCNANINVDSSLNTVVCEYCNTTFATANFLTTQTDDVHTNASTELESHTNTPAEFEIRDGVLESYNGNSVDIIVPDNVVHIGDNAFKDLGRIRSVTIPNGVLSIGKRSFSGCARLESINIPETVVKIGFEPILENFGKLSELGIATFSGCTSLSDINISPSMWLTYTIILSDTPFFQKNFKNGCLCGGKLTWWVARCKTCGATPLFHAKKQS